MRSSWTYRGFWRQAHHGIRMPEGYRAANLAAKAIAEKNASHEIEVAKARKAAGWPAKEVPLDLQLVKKMQRRQAQRNLRFYKRHTRHAAYRKKEIDKNRASMAQSG